MINGVMMALVAVVVLAGAGSLSVGGIKVWTSVLSNNEKDDMQLLIVDGRSPRVLEGIKVKNWPGSWNRRRICKVFTCICLYVVYNIKRNEAPILGGFCNLRSRR